MSTFKNQYPSTVSIKFWMTKQIGVTKKRNNISLIFFLNFSTPWKLFFSGSTQINVPRNTWPWPSADATTCSRVATSAATSAPRSCTPATPPRTGSTTASTTRPWSVSPSRSVSGKFYSKHKFRKVAQIWLLTTKFLQNFNINFSAEFKAIWARRTTGQSGGVKVSVPPYLLSPSKNY